MDEVPCSAAATASAASSAGLSAAKAVTGMATGVLCALRSASGGAVEVSLKGALPTVSDSAGN